MINFFSPFDRKKNRNTLPDSHFEKVRSSILAGLLIFFVFGGDFVSESRADVDRTTVLALGQHLVSSYQVDKNYQRYVNSVSQATGRPPSGDEIQGWFARFLGQQTIIGQALQEGFGDRKEVRADVLRMERHMLTQTEGPFYEKLLREEKREFDPKDAYQKLKKVVSVEVIRVPLSAPDANDLAIDRLSSTALNNARKSGAVFYYRGDLAWPYLGFADLAATLEMANEPKSWWQFESAGLRVMAQIIEVKAQPVPPFDQVEATLRRMGDEAQKQSLRSKRKEAILALPPAPACVSSGCDVPASARAESIRRPLQSPRNIAQSRRARHLRRTDRQGRSTRV